MESKPHYLTDQQFADLQATNGQPIECKAAVAWEAKKPLDVTTITVAPPKAGEVRVKVIANALCHTDIYTLDGCDPEGKFPSILGHEAAGIIESIGEGVTSLKVGDVVIPCYTPECKKYDCIYCQSEKTNLCPQIRATQGQGVMPDGTSRFSKDGKPIYHFMGCSTFSEYTVIAEISAAKISHEADLNKICMLGCGVSTGWGAVFNNCDVKPRSTVVVFGLGAVGLSVVQAAKHAGAKMIVGVDPNPKKKEAGIKMGCTDFVNPMELPEGQDIKQALIAMQKWGYDYTFDCTGITKVMRDALEVAHRGTGESCVIGVAASGHEISTRPFQLVTGRSWKGTAFGGWKSRTEVPKLVQSVMRKELEIDEYVTHEIKGLENVNESIDALHGGECLRAVVHISEFSFQGDKLKFTQASNNKVHGGYLKRITHWSETNQCDMTFSIFIPAQTKRTEEPPAVLFYLSGLTCSDENARTKSAIYEHAAKYNLAVVFPDTSPRGEEVAKLSDTWEIGQGAGFYVNATTDKWKKHFNMHDYVTKELPQVVDSLFNVNMAKKAVMGHSMGGHGAVSIHLRNPGLYRSVSAFSPILNPTNGHFGRMQFEEYLGSLDAAKAYDSTELIKSYDGPKLPILIDIGTHDEFLERLMPEPFQKAAGEAGYPINLRMQPGYDHSYYFISTFIGQHVDFHATNLGLVRRS